MKNSGAFWLLMVLSFLNLAVAGMNLSENKKEETASLYQIIERIESFKKENDLIEINKLTKELELLRAEVNSLSQRVDLDNNQNEFYDDLSSSY